MREREARDGLTVSDVPKGPREQKRPADVVVRAVHVAKIAKIATGEIEDTSYKQPNKVKSGKAGGGARAAR